MSSVRRKNRQTAHEERGYHIEQGHDQRWRIIESYREDGVTKSHVLASQSFPREAHARRALLEIDPQAKLHSVRPSYS